jgi:epoxyqueuosine reductase
LTDSDAHRLTDELRQRARDDGFDGVGVARAARLDRDAEALRAWLGNDRHAAMAWLARDPDKRADPGRLLPDCRSVVVLTMNYFPGEEAAQVPPGRARLALYARGRDYHKVIGRKLKRLAAWLEDTTGSPARAFVDTGPVLERAWAERAGVGWIGKNSCLLTRESGSWLLLAEILTTAELAPDPGPHADFCGSCTACIEACPTTAIVAPGVVDSRRCISYWTIEHRGPIPDSLRPGIADWIFGCDLCQDVCPWNHKASVTVPPDRFELREYLRGLDPVEVLAMDEATFRARYSGTSLMRAKWQGMRRNACVVIGNRGEEMALPALERALDDADPVVRSHAAWAVRKIGGPRAEEILRSIEARGRPESTPETG